MSPGVTMSPDTSRTVSPSRPVPRPAERPSRKPTSVTASIPWDGSMTRPPRSTRSKAMASHLTFHPPAGNGSWAFRQRTPCLALAPASKAACSHGGDDDQARDHVADVAVHVHLREPVAEDAQH